MCILYKHHTKWITLTERYDAIYILYNQSSIMPCDVQMFKMWDEMALDFKKSCSNWAWLSIKMKTEIMLPQTPLPLINFESYFA